MVQGPLVLEAALETLRDLPVGTPLALAVSHLSFVVDRMHEEKPYHYMGNGAALFDPQIYILRGTFGGMREDYRIPTLFLDDVTRVSQGLPVTYHRYEIEIPLIEEMVTNPKL